MKAITVKNGHGFFVGCIEYDNGVIGKVTNAKTHKWQADEIAQRMVRYYAERKHNEAKYKPCYH